MIKNKNLNTQGDGPAVLKSLKKQDLKLSVPASQQVWLLHTLNLIESV